MELFKYYDFVNNNDRAEDDITLAIDTLLNADKPIYMSGHLPTTEIYANNHRDTICQLYRKGILNGRKFCGEPEDFNY